MTLHVVRQSEAGAQVIEGTPKVALLETHQFGGVWDRLQRRWCPERKSNPVRWFASKEQAELAMHGKHVCREGCKVHVQSVEQRELPDKLLVYGAMGSGKTETQSMWAIFRAFEMAGTNRQGLLTAPTADRTEVIHKAITTRCPSNWYSFRAKDKVFYLHLGVSLRLATTTQRSSEQGSPIQGWNISFHGGDEYQDQIAQWGNIAARGRSAPDGRYKQLCTATAKDSPLWRAARDKLRTSTDPNGDPQWKICKILSKSNPFVYPTFWSRLIEELGGEGSRDTRRLVYAEDVGPELCTYPGWVRKRNLQAKPMLGYEDVTEQVLRPYAGRHERFTCLVGVDPGRLTDCSIILKAYRKNGSKQYVWWVVDEVITEQVHPAEHIKALTARLRDEWGCYAQDYAGRTLSDSAKARILIDPFGNTDSRTDRTVKQWFQEMGLEATNAATSKRPGGSGRIPKDAGIKMVDRLLGTGRLFIDCDDRGQPVAPELVEAFELEERDPTTGEAEVKRAHKKDRSHYPAALRYALWLIEKLPVDTDESFTSIKQGILRKKYKRAWS